MSFSNNYSDNYEMQSLGTKLRLFQKNSVDMKKSDLENEENNNDENNNFNENETLDDSIENLQNQIDETEAAIENITLNIDETKIRHQSELEDIENQIKEATEIAEAELKNQQEQFSQEYNEAQLNFEEEIKSLQNNLQKGHEGNVIWSNYRQELSKLGNQSAITEMEQKMENEKSKLQEFVSIQKLKQEQKNFMKQDIQYENETRLRSLEDEISNLQSQKREKQTLSRIKISELTENIESKTKEHQILLERMTLECNQRDAYFDAHLQSVNQMIEKEQMKTKSDNQINSNKIESLQKIMSSISKRGSLQLQEMLRDIEKMKKSIEDARRGEEAFAEKSRQQMSKMLVIKKEAQASRDAFQSIVNELNEVRALNQFAVVELQKAEKQASQKNRSSVITGYSGSGSRYKSTKNSIF